ncbi:SCP2 sterol-binding domain-containing protein [Amaricoccus sp.]|uniref:SCP2 sterol-binding domain-containing protein n=1 Tax=Amaricoccus sp. TaxID=1872485 RepID=UPI001B64E681|nr:SCP2 sterol-binding domain-containing protein [Amaricoccus sp.]MBP7243348.1 SCP2 sterol-binding domain-containing protein [Amaricoccus sp.]
MSDVLEGAVSALNAKLAGSGLDGAVKFVIEEAGALVLDGAGARIGDEEADCTLTADIDTFRALLDGDLDPTAAFMSGRLKVDGDMGLAMRLGSLLA